MRYESSPQISKALCILFSTIGIVFLYFSVAVATGFGAFIVLLISVLGFVIAIAALKAKYSVTVNLQNSEIEKRFRTLLINWVRRYPIADYTAVGVGYVSGSVEQNGVYFVQLMGRRVLKIRFGTMDEAKVHRDAKALSEYISLPFTT